MTKPRPRHLRKNLAGKRFGRLVAVEPVGQTNSRATIWLFRCDCGGERRTTKYVLTKPDSSCGSTTKRWIKHGHARKTSGQSKEYRTWHAMKSRCLNPKNAWYHAYGRAGITIDERWISSFVDFLRDVGLCPSDRHSLDRIDNDKGYFKDNVRWATPEQQSNNRTNNVIVSVNGITETLAQAARRYDLTYHTAKKRFLGDAEESL
jgi:hypothetical protein